MRNAKEPEGGLAWPSDAVKPQDTPPKENKASRFWRWFRVGSGAHPPPGEEGEGNCGSAASPAASAPFLPGCCYRGSAGRLLPPAGAEG
eukprot:9494494-Alexandrium_andersonii.AAC.1